MIKAIFFDFDGVLTTDKTGSVTTIRYLSEKTGIDQNAMWEAFAPFNDDLLYGRTSHSEIWPAICRHLGKEIDIGLLSGAFESTPMNQDMLELAKSLKRTCAIGIITDNKKDRIDFLKLHAGLDALFSPIVVSAECGSGKYGPDIFLHALEYVDMAPHEAIFIDNSKRNLLAAAALGMQTIYFDDSRNDVQGLVAALHSEHGVGSTRAA